MRARFPLYARILCWFFLNIGLLGAGLYLALRSGTASDWLIMQQAEPRLQSVSRLLVHELQPLPREEWTPVLQKYSGAYDMKFAVFGGSGRQLAGDSLTLPQPVQNRVAERPLQIAPPPQPPHPPAPGGVPGQPFRPGQPPFDEAGRPFPDAPQRGFVRQGEPRAGGPGQPPPRQDMAFAKFLERTDDPPAWWFIIK